MAIVIFTATKEEVMQSGIKSCSFVPSTAASACAERSSLYRNTPSQSDATHVQLLCSWCLVHRFMLTDGVCSLCPGQKLQNVNVPDKWLNVETVDTHVLVVSGVSLLVM